MRVLFANVYACVPNAAPRASGNTTHTGRCSEEMVSIREHLVFCFCMYFLKIITFLMKVLDETNLKV